MFQIRAAFLDNFDTPEALVSLQHLASYTNTYLNQNTQIKAPLLKEVADYVMYILRVCLLFYYLSPFLYHLSPFLYYLSPFVLCVSFYTFCLLLYFLSPFILFVSFYTSRLLLYFSSPFICLLLYFSSPFICLLL